jgi:hypothetical protein
MTEQLDKEAILSAPFFRVIYKPPNTPANSNVLHVRDVFYRWLLECEGVVFDEDGIFKNQGRQIFLFKGFLRFHANLREHEIQHARQVCMDKAMEVAAKSGAGIVSLRDNGFGERIQRSKAPRWVPANWPGSTEGGVQAPKAEDVGSPGSLGGGLFPTGVMSSR